MAGFCYALSGFFLSQLNLYNLVAGTALAPAFAAACVASMSGRRPALAAAGAGTLYGLMLVAGDPIIAALTLVLGLAALLVERDFDRGKPAAARARSLLRRAPRRSAVGRADAHPRQLLSRQPRARDRVASGLELGPAHRDRAPGAVLLRAARSALLGRDRAEHDAAALLLALSRAARLRAGDRGRTPAHGAALGGRGGSCSPAASSRSAAGTRSCSTCTDCRRRLRSATRSRPGCWSRSAPRCSPEWASSAPCSRARAARCCGRWSFSAPARSPRRSRSRSGTGPRSRRSARASRRPFPPRSRVEEVARWRATILISLVVVAFGVVLVMVSRRAPRIAGCALIVLHVVSQLVLLRPLLDTDDTAAYRTPPPALSLCRARRTHRARLSDLVRLRPGATRRLSGLADVVDRAPRLARALLVRRSPVRSALRLQRLARRARHRAGVRRAARAARAKRRRGVATPGRRRGRRRGARAPGRRRGRRPGAPAGAAAVDRRRDAGSTGSRTARPR